MSVDLGLWRHEDGTVCSSYPDSFDWTYVGPTHTFDCTHGQTLKCFQRCVLCPPDIDAHPFTDHLAKAEHHKTEAEAVVERVVNLWNRTNGWIPGGAYRELAEALGVSTDRLVHPGGRGEPRYYPPGVEHLREAFRIKPRDVLVTAGFRVASVSHLGEFHVTLRGDGENDYLRVWRYAPVSVVRDA